MKKFKTAQDNRRGGQSDAKGTVILKIYLASSGHKGTKGNIVRTLRLRDCRVSEVYNALCSDFIEEGLDDVFQTPNT